MLKKNSWHCSNTEQNWNYFATPTAVAARALAYCRRSPPERSHSAAGSRSLPYSVGGEDAFGRATWKKKTRQGLPEDLSVMLGEHWHEGRRIYPKRFRSSAVKTVYFFFSLVQMLSTKWTSELEVTISVHLSFSSVISHNHFQGVKAVLLG
jgi:hypothetical protein